MRRRHARQRGQRAQRARRSPSSPSRSESSASEPKGSKEQYTFWSACLAPLLYYDYTAAFLTAFYTVALWIQSEYLFMVLGLGRWLVGGGGGAGEQVELETRRSKRRHHGESKHRDRGSKDRLALAQDGFYPGMVNLSGVLCYMNSVLQALASVTSFVTHLDRIMILATETDLATPVTDAVSDLLAELNTPHHHPPRPIRPHALLAALHTLPSIRRLTSTREQQDAHELLAVLAEAISDEALKVASRVVKLRGVAEVLSLQAYCVEKGSIVSPTKFEFKTIKDQRKRAKGLAQPWEGLIARRRLCRGCGRYGEVRMDTLGGMELPVPIVGDTTLEACIAEYLAPELLSGVLCEACSLQATLEYYRSEVARLNGAIPDTPSSNSFASLESLPTGGASSSAKKTKKFKTYTKIRDRLQAMVDSGSVSHFGEALPYPGHADLVVKWQKVNADSVRETIVSRPPPTLRLHVARSGYTPYGQQVKKSARVAFPMVLDFTPFVSGGVWEGRGETAKNPQKVLYGLESVILHYGYTTSSGHFIAIRRRPSDLGDCFGPCAVTKTCPDGCRCQNCLLFGQVRGGLQALPGKGWLRISDDDVEEVGQEALVEARGAIFMMFYERIGEYVEQVETSTVSA